MVTMEDCNRDMTLRNPVVVVVAAVVRPPQIRVRAIRRRDLTKIKLRKSGRTTNFPKSKQDLIKLKGHSQSAHMKIKLRAVSATQSAFLLIEEENRLWESCADSAQMSH
jgi:hypothetical protein